MNIENRKYIRARVDCEILYPTIIYKETKKIFTGSAHLYAYDISEVGICLHSNFYIPNDSFVSFYFRIEDNLPFKTLVRIRWSKVTVGAYICGGEFISLNLSEIYILRNYIQSHVEN